jgi:hypothetical protein
MGADTTVHDDGGPEASAEAPCPGGYQGGHPLRGPWVEVSALDADDGAHQQYPVDSIEQRLCPGHRLVNLEAERRVGAPGTDQI